MAKLRIIIFAFYFQLSCFISIGQQNHTLFFFHQNPQTSFINPAVQSDCKIYIGLPVVSSIHLNAAHNGFTLKKLVDLTDSGYNFRAQEVESSMAGKNYLMTELYANILALGIKIKKNYLTFAIREKNDAALFYTKDVFSLIYNGNSQFEGRTVSFRNNGLNFNHYREFSLGISRKINDGLTFGIRGKLLFGKLNVSVANVDADLFTDENSFDLSYSGGFLVNAALPVRPIYNADGSIRSDDSYSPSLREIVFNNKNIGFAADVGFIYKQDENVSYSGSILDLGFIRYKYDVTNYGADGNYVFDGFLGNVNESINSWRYYFDDFNNSVSENLSHEKYTYFLSPRIYLGMTRKLNSRVEFNTLVTTKIYKEKMISGLSLGAEYNLLRNIDVALNWSYIHRSFANVGLGFVLGRSPVQFYAVTDNVFGLIWPDRVRNINACLGFNILLGCKKENNLNLNECGCYWLKKAEEKNKRKEKLLRKKNSLFK